MSRVLGRTRRSRWLPRTAASPAGGTIGATRALDRARGDATARDDIADVLGRAVRLGVANDVVAQVPGAPDRVGGHPAQRLHRVALAGAQGAQTSVQYAGRRRGLLDGNVGRVAVLNGQAHGCPFVVGVEM